MPTVTNFGDVVTQGNTTATGNLTVQGTGISSFTSALSGVTMAGTLAVAGVTTHSSNIVPTVSNGCGIGTAGGMFGNVFSANTNVYNTANLFTANIWSVNVTNIATFQNSVYHFGNTFATGFTQTTGVIMPTTTGISGLGGPSLLFANAFLQTANIGSSTAQMAMNVTGNVYVSNSINVANVLAVTVNASYMNVITGGFANMASINVFTGANATFLTVQTLANVYGTANIVTSNTQTANIVTANVQNLNVSTGANVSYLNVSFIANVNTANLLTSNIQSANIVTANVQNLNVSTGANVSYLNVSFIANVNTANLLTSNIQSANIVTANVQNLNVSTGANVSYLNVTFVANVNTANLLTSNIQSANIVTANVQNLNVSTGANVSYLNVSFVANVNTANILTSNIQSANIVTANVQNLNVSTGANVSYLNVSFIANVNTANILTMNLQSANIVTANAQNLNVSTGANITTLFVQTYANILSSNIVSALHSTINVSSMANVYTANIYNGNVQSTMNVSGLLSATLLTGNASALMNINASNVTMGVLPFRNDGAIGQGATAISINGSVGIANQYLSSTGTSLQWVGPPAAIFSQVPTSTNQIFYNSGNVAIGVYNWTQFGVGYNTYPGVPLDVYGGSGSFSNVSDANQTGTIRIMQNASSWAANGGLEFKTGTNIAGAGHRIVTTELVSSSGIAPLIFQYRANTPVWSNAMVIHNGSTTPGYVGIGTMAPGFNLHVYQVSNTNPATITLQMSNTGQSSQLYLSNASGTTTQLYLNGPNLSSDGPVNSATLRNNAGDLRLAAQGTNPYIYLQNSTSNVGINSSTPTQTLDVQGYARIGSTSADTARLILGRAPGTTNFDYASMIESVSTFATNYQSTLKFYTHGTATTGADPTLAMTINPTQQVGIGIAPSYKFHVDNGAVSGIHTVLQASTITAGSTTSMVLGKALTANNSATFVWNHVGESLATNYLGIGYYGGDNKLCLTSNGYVGVGVTNPSRTLVVRRAGAALTDTAIMVANNGSGTGVRFQTYDLTVDANAWMGLGTDMGGNSYEHSMVFPYGTTNQGRQTFGTFNGTTYSTKMTILGTGNVGIGIAAPTYKLHVVGNSGDSALAKFTGIGASCYVYLDNDNAANQAAIQFNRAGTMQWINYVPGSSTDLRWYNSGGDRLTLSSDGSLTTTGSLNMTGNATRIKFNSTSTWSGDAGTSFGKLEYHAERWYVNAGSNSDRVVQFRRAGSDVSYVDNSGSYIGYGGTFGALVQVNRLRPYSSSYGSGYDTAAIEVREYNLEGATGGTEFARAPRIGMHWAARVASQIIMESSGRIGIWNNPGTAQEAFTSSTYYCTGNVGIGMSPSYRLDCAGRGYLFQSQQSGYGWNRFTGLEADTVRAQFILNSSYSDLIISSSEYNGNHGSTISFTANSPANNDYRKFVINQNGWTTDASGTGGYGDRLAFQWQDGAYTNPHSYVSPGDCTLLIYGRGRSVGINNVRTPGYNLHINGNDYASGGRYTSDYFRVYGGGGLYNETYGGGWYMSDYTFMRINNDKWIYTGGNITAGSDIIAYYSDMRLKKNIEPITNAIDKIKTLSTFTYETNELGASFGLEEHVRNSGFSAQEVQKIMPEVVRLAPFDMGELNEVTGIIESKSGDNYMTLQYDKMAPLIVAALKEEVQKREDLEKEVAELKQLVQNLLARQ